MKKSERVNLIEKFRLHTTNKIKVETNKSATRERNYINKIIQEKEEIAAFLNELNDVGTMLIVDTTVDYNLTFYCDDKVICELGFFDDPKYPFLRYRSGGSVEYVPSKKFYDNFHNLIR